MHFSIEIRFFYTKNGAFLRFSIVFKLFTLFFHLPVVYTFSFRISLLGACNNRQAERTGEAGRPAGTQTSQTHELLQLEPERLRGGFHAGTVNGN